MAISVVNLCHRATVQGSLTDTLLQQTSTYIWYIIITFLHTLQQSIGNELILILGGVWVTGVCGDQPVDPM